MNKKVPSIRKTHVQRVLTDLKNVIEEERKCKHIPLSGRELHEVRHQFDVWLIKFASDIILSEDKR